jgi:beta-glucosidase
MHGAYLGPEYSDKADGAISVSSRVSNIGKRAGDEVVQLYLTHLGIDRDRDLSLVDGSGVRGIIRGEVKAWIGGGQPIAGPGQSRNGGVETGFRITSSATLPD